MNNPIKIIPGLPASNGPSSGAIASGELFIDHYRPRQLADCTGQEEVVERLQQLAKNATNLPHLMIQGPPGCGKKSLSLAFLAAIFGPNVYQLKQRTSVMSYPNKEITLQFTQSSHHYQVDPSAYGVYDRLIIQDFIKGMVKYQTVNQVQRLIIIHNADRLTHEAQQSLRRTLEKYIDSCRFIFICINLGHIIPALQSRCVHLRVRGPDEKILGTIASRVAHKEGLQIPPALLQKLLRNNSGGINTFLNQLEKLVYKYGRQLPEKVKLSDYAEEESYYVNIINQLGAMTDLADMGKLRDSLYDLLVHCVEPVEIINRLFNLLLPVIPDQCLAIKLQLIAVTGDHDHRIRLGSKPIYHLESYLVRVMMILKEWGGKALAAGTPPTGNNNFGAAANNRARAVTGRLSPKNRPTIAAPTTVSQAVPARIIRKPITIGGKIPYASSAAPVTIAPVVSTIGTTSSTSASTISSAISSIGTSTATASASGPKPVIAILPRTTGTAANLSDPIAEKATVVPSNPRKFPFRLA